MSAPSSGRKTPVDYGVQVRFVDEYLHSGPGKPVPQPKYGVAVRVQGIAGQPYVVLKDGQKGDSYGVQLKTHYSPGYNSLPRNRESETQVVDAGGGGGGRDQGGALRRAQSHGSLLDRDGEGGYEDFHLSRPPGDGKSGSYGNLDGGIGLRAERDQTQRVSGRDGSMQRNMWGGSHQTGLNGTLQPGKKSHSHQDPPHQTNEFQSNQRQTNVSRQVNRFDGGQTVDQRRPPAPEHSANQRTSPGRYPSAAAPQASLSEAQVRIHFVLPRSETPFPGCSMNCLACKIARAVFFFFLYLCLKVTPDLLLDQGQSAEMSSEEEQLMQNVYNILKQGYFSSLSATFEMKQMVVSLKR